MLEMQDRGRILGAGTGALGGSTDSPLPEARLRRQEAKVLKNKADRFSNYVSEITDLTLSPSM